MTTKSNNRIIKCLSANRIVAPKKAKLDEALKSLHEKQAALAEAMAKLEELQRLLEKLRKDYEEKLAMKEELRQKVWLRCTIIICGYVSHSALPMLSPHTLIIR